MHEETKIKYYHLKQSVKVFDHTHVFTLEKDQLKVAFLFSVEKII